MHKLGRILQVQNSVRCTFVAEGTPDRTLHLQNSAKFVHLELQRDPLVFRNLKLEVSDILHVLLWA